MAKKLLNVPIVNIDGLEIKEAGKTLTVQSIIISALAGNWQDEQGVTGDDKFNRFMLAMKVNEDPEQDLTPEDIVLIKKLVGKNWGPLVVGPVYKVLNG